MVILSDRNMVVEDTGYFLGDLTPKKVTSTTVKKTHEEAEIDNLGVPSKEEMERFLLNNVPLPSRQKIESVTEEEILAAVPSTAEMEALFLKPKTEKKAEEKVKTELEEIAESLGVEL